MSERGLPFVNFFFFFFCEIEKKKFKETNKFRFQTSIQTYQIVVSEYVLQTCQKRPSAVCNTKFGKKEKRKQSFKNVNYFSFFLSVKVRHFESLAMQTAPWYDNLLAFYEFLKCERAYRRKVFGRGRIHILNFIRTRILNGSGTTQPPKFHLKSTRPRTDKKISSKSNPTYTRQKNFIDPRPDKIFIDQPEPEPNLNPKWKEMNPCFNAIMKRNLYL